MLGKRALLVAAVGTGSALLTGTALYAFELNHLTSDAQHQIQNLSRQITAQEVSAFRSADKYFASPVLRPPVTFRQRFSAALEKSCIEMAVNCQDQPKQTNQADHTNRSPIFLRAPALNLAI